MVGRFVGIFCLWRHRYRCKTVCGRITEDVDALKYLKYIQSGDNSYYLLLIVSEVFLSSLMKEGSCLKNAKFYHLTKF